MADPERISSPVRALRDAFGDPKPPDISRKITACVACRKQKIKCHMRDSKPPCARCKKRGLSCTVNRSLQMLLEDDSMWKHSLEAKVQNLETVIEKIADHVSLPGVLRHLHSSNNTSPTHGTPVDQLGQEAARTDNEPPNQWEIVMDPDTGPEAAPASFIAHALPTPSRAHEDIISRGIISLAKAQSYFNKYLNRLDHFPYRILTDQSPATLDSIRQASPLLTAAVCTVGALHWASDDFDLCYDEFLSLCSKQTFSKMGTIDDVRALCIGAFWLSDLSWMLVGAAVRIATELQLHRSFFKAIQGDREHYLRARLYYLVYACDHHFSIPFGRPPMTRECEAIRNAREFLGCKHATEDDARLVSQVVRWSLCTNVFDTFGINVDRRLSNEEVPRLRRFNMALDNLRVEFANRFVPNLYVGNYPAKGVPLQYNFVKLYLCSHAFRGGRSAQFTSLPLDVALELDEAANAAVQSAISILRSIISDPEIQSFLDGLPTYFDIMIAFAVVFLFKVSTKASVPVRLDVEEVRQLVSQLVSILKRVTAKMHPRHLLVSLTKGIDGLLQRWYQSQHSSNIPYGPSSQSEQASLGLQSDTDLNWTDGFLDPDFMGEYDFLLGQDANFTPNFTLDAFEQQ